MDVSLAALGTQSMLSRQISGMDGGFLLGRGQLVVTRTSRQCSTCEIPSSNASWGVSIAKHGMIGVP